MDYKYIGYTDDKSLVKGTVAAMSQEAATEILSRRGYQVLQLKAVAAFVPQWDELFPSLFQVKPQEIIMFSRQLALLLESGTDIVNSLILLQAQMTNRAFRRVLNKVLTDLRAGNPLSVSLSKYPNVFPKLYCRSLSVGEQTGGLELVLRQIADYMEKETTAKKGVKKALAYPMAVAIVAIIVVGVLVTFVLPSFMGLYSTMGAELPAATQLLLDIVDLFKSSGIYLFIGVGAVALLGVVYTRTPAGKYQWDLLMLRTPMLGRVIQLSELSRCCRSMSLLFRSGLPLTEIMSMVAEGASNRVIRDSLTEIQQSMLKGEGLSQPMSKNPYFLPMMVQMVSVGEETGNLDVTLLATAQAYDAEADEKTRALVGVIQPAMTLTIGLVVAFITISLLSAMYSVFGQMG
ncbi:type II secretion system F family protein [Bacteroidota bacterium]